MVLYFHPTLKSYTQHFTICSHQMPSYVMKVETTYMNTKTGNWQFAFVCFVCFIKITLATFKFWGKCMFKYAHCMYVSNNDFLLAKNCYTFAQKKHMQNFKNTYH